MYEKYVPELLSKVKVLSEGAEVPFDDMFTWLSTMYGFGDTHGFTCFAFKDGK